MTLTAAAPPGTEPSRPRTAHRDFRLLWFGETTSSLGSSVTGVALPLIAISTLHVGVLAVSLLSAAAWLPWLVIGLPAGAWVDRLPRRPIMMSCDAVSMLVFVSVPVAAAAHVLTFGQLLAVALLAGTAKVFFATSYRSFLPTLLEPDELVAGNARLFGAESAASVAGPGLGGLLAQALGATNALLADAASFLVSLGCLRAIRAREAPAPRARQRLRAEIAQGLRFVAGDRLLRVLMVFGGAANLALTAYNAIVVVFLVRGVGLGAAQAGLLLAVGSTGGVLGALAAPVLARRLGSARALLLLKVGSTPFGLLIPLTGGGWRIAFFAVGAMGMVGGVVGGNVLSGGFMQAYCPPAMMGRIMTTMQVVNFGAIPIGAVLGGALADTLGFRPALWVVFAGFVAFSGILLAAPIRGQRDLPAGDHQR